MVAIFTGAGFGFERGSGSVLGGGGLLGSALHGRGGEGVSVNAATGNLVLQKQDEFLVGRGPDASVTRTYNSLTDLSDDNNDKWRQSNDRRVYGLTGTVNTAGSSVKRVSGDGAEIVYTWDAGASAYVSKEGGGTYDTIVRNSNGTEWIWTDGSYDDLTVEKYDYTLGRLKSVVNGIGQAVTFTYDASGRMDTATTNDGAWIRYDWESGTNKVTQIVTGYTDLVTSLAATLTRTRYGYDILGRLQTVTADLSPQDNDVADNQVYVTTYEYDASSRVNSITQSDGSDITITYDSAGRVVTLRETQAVGVTRLTTLSYGTGYTVLTDAAGQATRLDYDANGNLTAIIAPPAFAGAAQQVTQFAYNASGDLISITDARGAITTYSDFASNGAAQTIQDRAGNTVTRVYGSVDRSTGAVVTDTSVNQYSGNVRNVLLSETRTGVDQSGAAVSETTRYAYDTGGRLRYKVSAEGRVSEFTWGSYSLRSEVVYPEATYTATGTLTEATMNAWRDALPDRSWIEKTAYTYDARYNLSQTTTYSNYSSTGTGVGADGITRKQFVYDQAGQLLSTRTASSNATTYVYDGMGRIAATTDVNGGTTTFVFNDAALTTTVTLASGYVKTQSYNKFGDLVSETDSGTYTTGGTAQYAYDNLGRVRVRTDATGLKTYTTYDGSGRLVGEVNNDGFLTEYQYDAADRLIGTIQWHNAISGTNLTALGDANNTLSIANLRPSASSQDTASWTVYDAEGRVLQEIDGAGRVTGYTYDASGHLLKKTGYATSVSVSGFKTTPPTAPVAVTSNSADKVVRNFYDRDGILVGSLDGEGYLTKHAFDSAGRIVSTTRYANATVQAQRASGSFTTLLAGAGTSPQDRTSRLVYDGRGLLRYSIDALNQVTAYYYNTDTETVARTSAYDVAIATGTTDFSFDNIRSLTATQEASTAKRTTYRTYDPAGRLAYTVSPAGGITGFQYDTLGRVTRTVAYSAIYAITFQPSTGALDSWSNARLADAGNRVTRTWYTERGEAAFTVDGEGVLSGMVYDSKGQLLSSRVFDTRVSVSDTTTLAQVAAMATGGSVVTAAFVYDSLGRVTRAYGSASGTMAGGYTSYTYHGTTRLINTTTRAANGSALDNAVETAEYDASGTLLVQKRLNAGNVVATSTATVNGRGDLSTSVFTGTSISQATSYTYDLNGRVKTMTDAAGGVTTYEYNSFGEVWKVTDARGSVTYTWYDNLGRATTVRDAENYVTTTAYTIFGDVFTVRQWYVAVSGVASPLNLPALTGNGATTAFTYDKSGRVLTTTDAEGGIESYTYNAFGERATITGRLGAITTFTYDRLGQLVAQSVTSSGDQLTDGSGTLLPNGWKVVTQYDYDVRGNRIAMREGHATSASVFTALRTTTYEYDANDQVTKIIHDVVDTINDAMVITAGTAADAPFELFAYDARGNVIRAVDANGAQTFSYYDDLDRKILEVRQANATQAIYRSFSYDAADNLISTRISESYGAIPTAPGGAPPAFPQVFRETRHTYDNLGRIVTSAVASNPGNLITSGSFDGTNWTTDTTDLVTTYQYDATGNVVKVTDPRGAATWSWYDKRGNRTAQLDNESYLTRWTHDADGNVLSEVRYATRFTGTPTLGTAPTVATNGNDRTTTYSYDENGNRLSESRMGVQAWDINSTNGTLTQSATTTSTIVYTYNALGQVLTKTVGGQGIATYTYDKMGRLRLEARQAFLDVNGQMVTPTTSYQYDALGNLTKTTQAAGSSGTHTASARVTTNVYGQGGRLLSSIDAEGKVHFYYYDKVGRQKADVYARIANGDMGSSSDSTLGTSTDAQTVSYDLAGRVIRRAVFGTPGDGWAINDYSSYQYNTSDEVVLQGSGSQGVGINSGNARYQVTNQYDAAGRLVGTNGGDGVWKFFAYDKAGNQSAAITSAGQVLSASTGFASAWALASSSDANVDRKVNATLTAYDKRGQAISVDEEARELSIGESERSVSSRTYNAFGEMVTQTNAMGARLAYSYNAMGRMVRSEGPAVQITAENGSSYWIKPSEDYYYDIAGRLIGTRDANGSYATTGGSDGTATSKAANTGNLVSNALLAGTGYDGGKSLVSMEYHSDGGKKQTLYDIMGDARVLRSELYEYDRLKDYEAGKAGITKPNLYEEEQSFDRLGNLVQVRHQRRVDQPVNDRLIDTYVYDQFGRRLQHYNNQLGTGQRSKTQYDELGRIRQKRDFGGQVTSIAYQWDGTLTPNGVNGGNFALGGWVETTTYGNTSRKLISKTDIYDREVSKTDLGGNVTTNTFDAAGRLISRSVVIQTQNDGPQTTTQSFKWLNTGLLAQTTGQFGSSNAQGTETYTYDKAGNRLTERLVIGGVTVKEAGATYDALGRMKSWAQQSVNVLNGSTNYSMPGASTNWSYDAVGNIRKTSTSHWNLDTNGAQTDHDEETLWFRYDVMNRLVVDRGVLSGPVGGATTVVKGVIVADGSTPSGQEFTYNKAGQRTSAARYYPNQGTAIEYYDYNGAGLLSQIREFDTANNTLVRSSYDYDLMGRQTHQRDFGYLTSGGSYAQVYAKQIYYNPDGSIWKDSSWTVKTDNSTYSSTNTYSYTDNNGQYLLGAVGSTTGDTKINGVSQKVTSTVNQYVFWDTVQQARIDYKPDINSSTTNTTVFNYNGLGQLTRANINDGRARSVYYLNDGSGQAIRRDEVDNNPSAGDPHEIWYRFGGREIGYIGNNGTTRVGAAASINDRRVVTENGAFRNGAIGGAAFTEFTQSYDPLNSYSQGSSAGSYTVEHTGETLRSIAQMLWGDSALWYKIAEANGLSADMGLVEGQRLTLPQGVNRTHNNASTLKPYDANDVIGNVSPTAAKPPKSNKCGVVGQIFLAAIAIAVTALALPAGGVASASLLQGGLAGFAGAAASQTVGVATGLQQKFDFKGLALGAIGGAVGAGIGFDKIANSPFLSDAATGALRSAVTQGVGVATGLQSKFDFVGVAAAGIGAGVGGAVARNLDLKSFSEIGGRSFGNRAGYAASGVAGALSAAVTRSAISGSNFGDNIIRALPDAIANTIGNLVADQVVGGGKSNGGGATAGKSGDSGNGAQSSGTRAGGTDAEFGDIIVTARRPYSDFFQLSQYRPNPRGGMGGNGGPPLYDPMTLRDAAGPIMNTPAGPVLGVVDGFLDLTGPANALVRNLYLGQRDTLIDQLKSLDPDWSYASLGEPVTTQGRLNDLNNLRAQRASMVYSRTGDTQLLQVETLRTLQRFVDDGYALASQRFDAGLLSPRLNRNEAIGNFVDRFARQNLQEWYKRYGVNIGPALAVGVNNRAYSADSSYRIPDVRVGNAAFDMTLSLKTASTPQVQGFFNARFAPASVTIVRPIALGGSYIIPRPRH